jgi:hypothetical protein
MMERGRVSETSVFNSTLAPLMSLEDFSAGELYGRIILEMSVTVGVRFKTSAY